MAEMTDEERVTDGIVRDLESRLANKDAFISALTSYVRHLETVLADREAKIAGLKETLDALGGSFHANAEQGG